MLGADKLLIVANPLFYLMKRSNNQIRSCQDADRCIHSKKNMNRSLSLNVSYK